MISFQRVLWWDGSSFSDLSVNLGNFRSDNAVIPLETTHYLYIGSDLPFNHRHFEVNSPNAVTSALTVENWDGREWVAVVDKFDLTSTAGATLAKSGILRWSTDIDESWSLERESKDVEGLESTKIYNMYWLRISVSANITASTELSYIGHVFSTDNDLYSFYPDLDSDKIKDSYKSGATSWAELHFVAAQEIILDLKRRNLTLSENQITEPEIFRSLACHKVADIVYGSFGKRYIEERTAARKSYEESINLKFFKIDEDGDGHVNRHETFNKTGFATR